MNDGLNIRTATLQDIPFLSYLIHTGIGEWAKGIENQVATWREAISHPDSIAERLASPAVTTFILEDESSVAGTIVAGTIVAGTISVDYLQEMPYLSGLYVARKGHGYGKFLIETVLSECRANGYTACSCAVYENNLPALSLFSNYGSELLDKEIYEDATYLNLKLRC